MRFIMVVMIADRFAVSLTCRHCDPAPCAIACPPGALSFGDDGLKLEADKCTGSTLCEFACPFGMMSKLHASLPSLLVPDGQDWLNTCPVCRQAAEAKNIAGRGLMSRGMDAAE